MPGPATKEPVLLRTPDDASHPGAAVWADALCPSAVVSAAEPHRAATQSCSRERRPHTVTSVRGSLPETESHCHRRNPLIPAPVAPLALPPGEFARAQSPAWFEN